VVDGTETVGLEGAWENNFHSPPPDYIYYIEDGRTPRYGLEAPRQPYKINGRRIDVEWFPRISADELEWYLKTYRDDWGVRIDYIVFTIEEFWSAANRYAGASTRNLDIRLLLQSEKKHDQPSVLYEDNKLIFDFGGDRSNVILDMQTNDAYLQRGGEQQRFDGYAFFGVRGGNFTAFYGHIPPPSPPGILETLLVFRDEDTQEILTAWLVKSPFEEYHKRGLYAQVPYTGRRIGVKAFNDQLADVDYLEIAFTSTNGYVVILEVNHQLI
jgi:hypothetical protein